MFQKLCFNLTTGQAIQIKGKNGAGKSSLIRILSGLLPCEKGEVSWNNVPIVSANSAYLNDLLFIGHKSGINLQLTAAQNLAWYSELSKTVFSKTLDTKALATKATSRLYKSNNADSDVDGASEQTIRCLDDAYKTWKLYGFDDVPSNSLSAGQQRRIALCRLLIENKKLWLLDEPLVSLDVLGIQIFTDLAKAHLSNGGILIFSSHQELDLGECMQTLDLDNHQNKIESAVELEARGVK